MKYIKNILILMWILMTTGCTTSHAVTCVDLSTQFYLTKAYKINCLESTENSINDRKACVDVKVNLFKKNLRTYLQPYYTEATQFDNYLKTQGKVIKTNIPQNSIKLCSPFCIDLRNKMNTIFQSKTYKVGAINSFYTNKTSEYSRNVQNSLVVKTITFPEECRFTLQNLRKYNFRTKNKKDSYYYLYRREYIDCLKNSIKSNGAR